MSTKKFTPITEEVKANITTIFKSFDKDNSNSIDMKEIKLVAKELGQEVSDAEIKQIFGDIDTNKDNKISFTEFYNWWCYGKINKMERLVYYKLKAMNLLEKSKAIQSRMGRVLSEKYEEGVDNFHVGIKFGEAQPKTKLGVRVAVGKSADANFAKLTFGLNVDSQFALVIKIKVIEDPQAAEASLKKLIEKLKGKPKTEEENQEEGDEKEEENLPFEAAALFNLIDFQVRSDNDFLYLIVSSQQEFINDAVYSTIDQVSQVHDVFDGNIHASLGLKNDLKVLMNEFSAEKLVLGLLEGFSFVVEGSVNSDFTKNARKELTAEIEKAGNIISKELRTLSLLSLAKGAKVDITLKELEKTKLQNFFKAIGSFKALEQTPSFMDLLGLLKKAKSFLDLKELLKTPAVSDVISFIKSHLKANVEIHVKIAKALFTLEFETSGIKECYDYLIDSN